MANNACFQRALRADACRMPNLARGRNVPCKARRFRLHAFASDPTSTKPHARQLCCHACAQVASSRHMLQPGSAGHRLLYRFGSGREVRCQARGANLGHSSPQHQAWPFLGAGLEMHVPHRLVACAVGGRGLQLWRIRSFQWAGLCFTPRRSLGALDLHVIACFSARGVVV